jgi:D-citramalate synthase
MEAIKAGIKHMLQSRMGRAGNAPLESTCGNQWFLAESNVKNPHYTRSVKLVETFRYRIPANKPIVGDNVFTQTAGIHADGDNKTICILMIYFERFGKIKYALGKTSGR